MPSLTGARIHEGFSLVLTENSLGHLEELPLLEPNVLFKQSGKGASIVRAHRWPEPSEPADGIVIVQKSIYDS